MVEDSVKYFEVRNNPAIGEMHDVCSASAFTRKSWATIDLLFGVVDRFVVG